MIFYQWKSIKFNNLLFGILFNKNLNVKNLNFLLTFSEKLMDNLDISTEIDRILSSNIKDELLRQIPI